jgi:hypothetical protein
MNNLSRRKQTVNFNHGRHEQRDRNHAQDREPCAQAKYQRAENEHNKVTVDGNGLRAARCGNGPGRDEPKARQSKSTGKTRFYTVSGKQYRAGCDEGQADEQGTRHCFQAEE